MEMRKKANRSLVILTILFVGAACLVYLYPDQWWSRMLLYTTEAGLVGALADLFAVTVLFKHPFGWKWIPHTAIIPKNRDKLIDGVAAMVEQQLLSKVMLKEKVKSMHLVQIAVDWVDRRPKGMVSEPAWTMFSQLLNRIDLNGVSIYVDEQSRRGLRSLNMAPYAGKALKWAMERGNFQSWISSLIEVAAQKAAEDGTKQAIRDMLAKEKEKFVSKGNVFAKWIKKIAVEIAESTDSLNLSEAAEALHGDLLQFINELRNPKHELRILLEDMVLQLADDLQNREDFSAAVSEWRDQVLEKVSFLPAIEAALGNIRLLLTDDIQSNDMVKQSHSANQTDIKQLVNRLVQSYWDWFKSNQDTKDWLEQYAQSFVHKMIDTEHAIIGVIVRKTLESFTEQKLVHFIESKVETDLQRIRINGAYIGAALGAAFYIILYGVYEPLLGLL